MATFAFLLIIIVLLPIVAWMAWIAFDNALGELYDDIDRIKDWMHRTFRRVRHD
jgi:hypothetical protein